MGKIRTIRIGNIRDSRLYIGLEIRTYKSDRPRIFTGATYQGTTHGLIITGGRLSLLAHTRKPRKEYA